MPLEPVKFHPFNESGFEKTSWQEYTWNHSEYYYNAQGTIALPYNSTLWLDDQAFELPAPFLDVGLNCSADGTWNSLGNCICYKGKPLDVSFLHTGNALCNTAPGFAWGFSTNIVRLGFILEAVWLFCFIVAYLCIRIRSKLLWQRQIKTAGIVRLALEFGYSIFEDLGFNAGEHSEEELLKKLEGKKVTYRNNPSTIILGSSRRPFESHEAEPARLRSLEQVGTAVYKHRNLGVYE
jgi:hypothetical protein